MQSLRTRFLQPYPFERGWALSLKGAVYTGLFVTLFLFFFKPFGTQINPGAEGKYLIVCSYFGLVTMVVSLMVNGFCLLLPKIFDEEKWKVWKEILFNLFFVGCIGTGNLLLANALWGTPMNFQTFLSWQLVTFAVGIFPAFFGAILSQVKLSKKYAAEASRLHVHTNLLDTALALGHQGSEISHVSADVPVALIGENQNETLNLQAAQIAYLAAQDNYVQVFFFENGMLKSRMLRATLRKMEDALADCPQFFRCHRTFVINFDRVEKVGGNAQGYRLHLKGIEETIPVSRNLNDVFRARLRA